MKLTVVDKSGGKGMNGADIPHGTVFTSVRISEIGLYVKYCRTITIISASGYITGHVYADVKNLNFPNYKVVSELTAVVK